MLRSLAILVLAVLQSACSSYALKVRKSLQLMDQGQFVEAAKELKEPAMQPGRDQVAYLLDYALMQQYAGDFSESSRAFQMADRLTEVKDYISLSDEAASLVFSESMVAYKGDDYEKMLINAFNAVNYAAMGELESALVEIRRLNDKLNAYRNQAGRDYNENPMVPYLSAILWETQRQWDSACIDYERTYKVLPELDALRDDLLFCSYMSKRWEKHEEWKKKFRARRYGPTEVAQRRKSKELVVLQFVGKGPYKQPHPSWHRIAQLVPSPRYSFGLPLQVGSAKEKLRAESLVNIQDLAIDSFDKQYGKLIAKRIAARIVKDQIVQRMEKDDKGAAAVAQLIMDLSDQADLRQWSALPAEIKILRWRFTASEEEVSLSVRDPNFQELKSYSLQRPQKRLQFVLLKDHYLISPSPEASPALP